MKSLPQRCRRPKSCSRSPASEDMAAAPAAVEVPAAIEVLEDMIDGRVLGGRVSLDFEDVAIADVLRLIAEVWT